MCPGWWAHARAWGTGRGRTCCPTCLRWARGSRPGAAPLRTGGEEEYTRTGDTNPGCNYLVRGYNPFMHFFWRGDMPHYSPPLPFRRGRVGCPCVLARSQPAPALRSGVVDVRPCRWAHARPRVADVRSGWWACARGRGRGYACWLAGTHPRQAWGSQAVVA